MYTSAMLTNVGILTQSLMSRLGSSPEQYGVNNLARVLKITHVKSQEADKNGATSEQNSHVVRLWVLRERN